MHSNSNRLDQLDTDDFEKLREARLAEMKKRAQMKQEWMANVTCGFYYLIYVQ